MQKQRVACQNLAAILGTIVGIVWCAGVIAGWGVMMLMLEVFVPMALAFAAPAIVVKRAHDAEAQG